jgi:hypothetical protein
MKNSMIVSAKLDINPIDHERVRLLYWPVGKYLERRPRENIKIDPSKDTRPFKRIYTKEASVDGYMFPLAHIVWKLVLETPVPVHIGFRNGDYTDLSNENLYDATTEYEARDTVVQFTNLMNNKTKG